MFRGGGQGPPVDFGGDLQRAQSLLSKYGKGSSSPLGSRASGRRTAPGRPSTTPGRDITQGEPIPHPARPSTARAVTSDDSSLSLSEEDLSASIVLGDEPPAAGGSKGTKGRAGAHQGPTRGSGVYHAPTASRQSTARGSPSPDISISFSDDDLSGSIVVASGGGSRKGPRGRQQPEKATHRRRSTAKTPSPDISISFSEDGSDPPVPSKKTRATRPLGRNSGKAAVPKSPSSDVSISFSEDGTESRVSVKKPQTRKADQAKASVPKSPSPDISISFSEDGSDASAPIKKPQPATKTVGRAKTALVRSPSPDISISFSDDSSVDMKGETRRTTPANRKAPSTRAPSRQAVTEARHRRRSDGSISIDTDLSSSGDIVIDSSPGVVAPGKTGKATKAAPAAASAGRHTAEAAAGRSEDSHVVSFSGGPSASEHRPAAEGRTVPRGVRKPGKVQQRHTAHQSPTPSPGTSIEFSEDEEASRPRLAAKSIGQWQPPGSAPPTASAQGRSASNTTKPGSAARRGSKDADLRFSMTASDLSQEIESAAAATADLYAMMEGRAVAGDHRSPEKNQESVEDSFGAELSAELGSQLQEAAAATEALFGSLQPVRAGSGSGSSSPGSSLAANSSAAAAVTEAAAATDELYAMLGRVGDNPSEERSGTLKRSPAGAVSAGQSRAVEEAADATAALYAMLVPVTEGGQASPGASSANSELMAEAAEAEAATSALFDQLAMVQTRQSSSEATEGEGASGESGSDQIFGSPAPMWNVKGDSLVATQDEVEAGDLAPTASASADDLTLPLCRLQPHETILPLASLLQKPQELPGKPGHKSVGTQIGTMNEMACQVGFDERYRLLYDGCTLPKTAHLEFQASGRPASVPQYVPGDVPGGWIPWGALAPQAVTPQPAGPSGGSVPPTQLPASNQSQQQPQARARQPPSPEPSEVDDYSMSFEKEETMMVSFGGATIKRTVRDVRISQSFVSESVIGTEASYSRSHHGGHNNPTGDGASSFIEESVAGRSESVYSSDSDASEELPARRIPAPSAATRPVRPALKAVTSPRQNPHVWDGRAADATRDERPQVEPQQQQQQGQERPPVPQPQGVFPVFVPYMATSTPPGAWMVPTSPGIGHVPPGMAPLLHTVPLHQGWPMAHMDSQVSTLWGGPTAAGAVGDPSRVSSGAEDLVGDKHADDQFRHQVGVLRQRLARFRLNHEDSCQMLRSEHLATYAAGIGGHPYTSMEETITFIRANYPHK